MKKILLITFISLLFFISINAQQVKGISGDNNWAKNWTNFKPKSTEYKVADQELRGIIDKNTLLTKNNTYLIFGTLYVTNNAILTIEPGTVIRGDVQTCGTLVITKGSKLIAEGSATDPIVFTSNSDDLARKAGDWGGIVILGDAPINKIGGMSFLDFNFEPSLGVYGGENASSNSGVLKYIRIEFPGRKINATKELNGLSLAGVGKGTKLEYIQISFSNDDSFECYGGDVIFKNLISFRATDDDFDFTQGAQCSIEESIAIRNPYSSDISGSRCFEIDSYDKVENLDTQKKLTKIKADNITLVNLEENSQGLVREAIYLKERSYFSMTNSLIDGFSTCLLLESKIGVIPSNLAKINIQNIQVNLCKNIAMSEDATNYSGLLQWYNTDTFSIETTSINKVELYLQPNIKQNPDFRTKRSNIIASNN